MVKTVLVRGVRFSRLGRVRLLPLERGRKARDEKGDGVNKVEGQLWTDQGQMLYFFEEVCALLVRI
jgi:hypothetical protein